MGDESCQEVSMEWSAAQLVKKLFEKLDMDLKGLDKLINERKKKYKESLPPLNYRKGHKKALCEACQKGVCPYKGKKN